MMHEVYLPFPEETLRRHFARTYAGKAAQDNSEKHLEYYRRSIERYRQHLSGAGTLKSRSLSQLKFPCQIEKSVAFGS